MGNSKNNEKKFGLTISLTEAQVNAIEELTKQRSRFIRVAIDELLQQVNALGWDTVKEKIV